MQLMLKAAALALERVLVDAAGGQLPACHKFTLVAGTGEIVGDDRRGAGRRRWL